MMAPATFIELAVSLIVFLPNLCCAESQLRGGSATPSESVSVDEVQKSLLEEINDALNTNVHQGDKLQQFEAELTTMFSALPKNDAGRLGHATVHYALHRLFMQRHGWFFRGLEPAGGAWSSLTTAGIVKDRVPSYVQELFEEQLGGQGFGLRELAVLAATLEHLVTNEAQQRLKETFLYLNLPEDAKLSKEKFDEVLDVYMVAQIVKANVSSVTPNEFVEMRKKATESFPDLLEAQVFIREMAVTYGRGMDFAAASSVLLESSKRLGTWHKGKCQSKKDRLILLGDRDVGRVALSSFYAAALSGDHTGGKGHTEHIDYLRGLGALDESVPQRPSVLVPNYINSQANCFASSSFYTVCCANECEGLLRHLEWEIAAPAAKPARIQQLVAHLPSSSVKVPRDLPASLLKRLDDIAAQHGGDVPIHGRLFAQWLHHAYPRECPYPHAAGATRPQTADEWMTDTGKESTHTREELEEYVRSANATATAMEVTEDADLEIPLELPWSDDEELLVVRPASWSTPTDVAAGKGRNRKPWRVLRNLVFVVTAFAMFFLIQEKVSCALAPLRENIGKTLRPPSVLRDRLRD